MTHSFRDLRHLVLKKGIFQCGRNSIPLNSGIKIWRKKFLSNKGKIGLNWEISY
jgi:hypothetical protein